jgi:hypothetical protein
VTADDDAATEPATAPLLRVVHGGDPTAEELAALVAVVATSATADPSPPPRSRWADRRAMLRGGVPLIGRGWR